MARLGKRMFIFMVILVSMGIMAFLATLSLIQTNSHVAVQQEVDFNRFLIDQRNASVNIKLEKCESNAIENDSKCNYKLSWSLSEPSLETLPWFMKGPVRPSKQYAHQLAIWPEEEPGDDRIVNQLMYIPPDYDEDQFVPRGKLPLKKILLFNGKKSWGSLPLGRVQFIEDKCPVSACEVVFNKYEISKADAVLFKDRFSWPDQGRPKSNQIWIPFLLENPSNTQLFSDIPPNTFSWTATYRISSEIVTPYAKFVPYTSILGDLKSLNRENLVVSF